MDVESIIQWLQSLPPLGIYAVLWFVTYIENVFPPSPSVLTTIRMTAATFAAAAVVFITSACDRKAPTTAAVASDSLAPAASGAETFFRYGLLVTAHTRKDLQEALQFAA